MENHSRHIRTVSKNFQQFRYFIRFITDEASTLEYLCKLNFKIGELWLPYITLSNILEMQSFNLSYVFEEPLDIKIDIVVAGQIIDEKVKNMVDLVSQSEQMISFSNGLLFVKVEEVKDSNSAVSLRVVGTFKWKMWSWRPQFSIQMCRDLSDSETYELYRSEYLRGSTCKWKEFTVPYNMLGTNSVKFVVLKASKKPLGEVKVAFTDLLMPGSKFEIQKNGEVKGMIEFSWSELKLEFSFIDYLREGINIKLMIAIDYTSSNKAYTLSTSNHFLSEEGINPYEASIYQISKALDVYNKEKVIDLYGFGGIPKGKTQVSHCFELGSAKNSEEAVSIYRASLADIELCRPTNFNELIKEAQKRCKREQGPLNYHVVLIITDGDIHDLPYTSTNIVHACKYPISFIIIGVGNADFRNMVKLDSDNLPLKDREGRIAERDIVQFVPFNQYMEHKGLFASKVLEEIPAQICGYMKNRRKYM